ncbi:MAG: GNAT family N-acetyltransferase [Cellvibrionaceae bacterium]
MDNSPTTIRKGVFSDAQPVCKIRVETWQKAYTQFMPKSFLAQLDPLSQLKTLQQKISNPSDDFSLFIAEKENNVIGFCISGKPRHHTNPDTVELQGLYVLPRYWGLKTGRSLIERCIEHSIQKKFDYIELWCIKGNSQAQRAYENCGFTQTGEERKSSASNNSSLTETLYRMTLTKAN